MDNNGYISGYIYSPGVLPFGPLGSFDKAAHIVAIADNFELCGAVSRTCAKTDSDLVEETDSFDARIPVLWLTRFLKTFHELSSETHTNTSLHLVVKTQPRYTITICDQ